MSNDWLEKSLSNDNDLLMLLLSVSRQLTLRQLAAAPLHYNGVGSDEDSHYQAN